ncbi:gliding motility protein GldL [Putridiphycobacter roseus]|uniref:Gliding motility protein GldL n=1 Tax=Putridiphycobacter roseus TaxID=2219161 RepID=A0A2W1NU85_9FLAO|nr:gliding motility protein GldL [Putridiphycobacter roseus]PZE18318.1 gliding motility protein GldL [Putridiphycobacter roseus]
MKPGSKKWKNFMAKLYGIGAAVVIVGALFKIMHWPFAGPMLVIGLSAEAIIFLFSAFEPLHEDPNWELVYPELALAHDEDFDVHAYISEKGVSGVVAGGGGGGGSATGITEHFDSLLEEAKIDADLLNRLGDGIRTLSENAEGLKAVSGAAAATDNYVASLEEASGQVKQLSSTYERASESILGLTAGTEDGASFGEQMQKVSTNLSALNSVYELQLKGSSAHLEATDKFQSQVVEMMANLSDSAEDTKRYKENMAMLSQNLTDLNQVYGNMLKAMTVSRD